MYLRFYYKDDSEKNELEHIVAGEATVHFTKDNWWNRYSSSNSIHKVYEIEVSNVAYYEDIEKMKESFYTAKNNKELDTFYFTDFISDVQENLSFVPKIEVVRDY